MGKVAFARCSFTPCKKNWQLSLFDLLLKGLPGQYLQPFFIYLAELPIKFFLA
jgi:hypothetical protein